jgi:hypothetical protein
MTRLSLDINQLNFFNMAKKRQLQLSLMDEGRVKRPKVKDDFNWGGAKWAEDIYREFDFIILPVLLFLGKEAELKEERQISDYLVELFLKPEERHNAGNIFHLEGAKESLWQFISSESRNVKYDFKRRTLSANKISPQHMLSMMVAGVEKLKSQGHDPMQLKSKLRDGLPKSSLPMHFSQLGRYILNGRGDQHWYRDTEIKMKKLFPGEDMDLIFNLFAATSIRASLESNVTKFFKALVEFKGGKKSKFLYATAVQLAHLKNGRPMGGGKKDKARKVRNFKLSMNGIKDAIVADIWLIRSFNVDKLYRYKNTMASRSPSMKTYDAIEWYLQTIAGLFDFEPREICSMIWGGIRSETNNRTTRYDSQVASRLHNGLFSDSHGEYLTINSGSGNFKEK